MLRLGRGSRRPPPHLPLERDEVRVTRRASPTPPSGAHRARARGARRTCASYEPPRPGGNPHWRRRRRWGGDGDVRTQGAHRAGPRRAGPEWEEGAGPAGARAGENGSCGVGPRLCRSGWSHRGQFGKAAGRHASTGSSCPSRDGSAAGLRAGPSSVHPPAGASAGWGLLARRPEELRYGGGRAPPLGTRGIRGVARASERGRETRAAVPGACGPRPRRCWDSSRRCPGRASGRDPRASATGRRRGRSAFLTGEIGPNGTLSGPRRTPAPRADLDPEAGRPRVPGGRAGRGGDRLLRRRRSRRRSGTRALQAVRPGGEACEPGSSGTPPPGCSPVPSGRPLLSVSSFSYGLGFHSAVVLPSFFPFPLMGRSRLGFINPETRAASKRGKRMVKAIYGRKKGLIFCLLSPWR